MPSLPVSDPTRINILPGFPDVARANLFCSTTPMHIALTSGFPEYDSEKDISPPTFGTPIQFPYPATPLTTSVNRYLLRGLSNGPNLSELSNAIGFAPIASMSRTMPPIPVAAPGKGAIPVGKLCVSAVALPEHLPWLI